MRRDYRPQTIDHRLRIAILLTLILMWLILPQAVCFGESPYSKWENGPSSDPNFFPIGVWLQNPSNAGKYQEIGINTYIGLWKGPTESQLAELNKYGMHVIAYQNNVGLTSSNNRLIQGWLGQDEPDNAQWNSALGSYVACVDPLIIQERYNRIKSNDPTRPVFLNFGRGLSDENWHGRGACTGRLDMYPEYIKGADIISFDIYPVNSELIDEGKLEYVARGVERLASWSNGSKIVWTILETTDINGSGIRPTPEEIRTEVWMSLIHGSMGIAYFLHEFYSDGRYKTDCGIFQYPEIEDGLTELNAQITALAPVLNSSTIENGAEVLSDVPVKFMVKRYDGSIYLFAVAMRNESGLADFTVFGIPDSATAEVLGEDRQITISNGEFQDNFDGYGVHLYKIESQIYKIEPQDIHYGDVTGNSEVSSYDASLAAQYAINLINLPPEAVQRADVTRNSEVSSYDASLIAQYAIGLIDGF